MRTGLAGFGAVAAAALFAAMSPLPAQAHDYPWCVASQHGTAQDCLFRTKAQCDAAASGYGTCIRNHAVPEMTEEPARPDKKAAKKAAAKKRSE